MASSRISWFAAPFVLFAFCSVANAGKPKTVTVTNFPPSQVVTGAVAVSNLPATQPVSGSVAVSNLPAVQNVNVVGGCSAGGWLAGFTAAQLAGDQGVLAFAGACSAEFPGSRMCSSRDIARTTVVPSGLSGTAWILPEFVGGDGQGYAVEAVSGKPTTFASAALTFTCAGWAGTYQGMTVDATGRFLTENCATPRSVACCVGP